MPSITELAKRASKLVSDNSPALLTATAVTGVVTTAVLAARASFEAADILAMEEELRPDEYIRMLEEERFGRTKLVWKQYIPAGIAGATTIAACLASQHISARRNATLLSVYSLTETAFKEYKAKVVEQVGETKERQIKDSIAEDRIKANPPSSEVMIFSEGQMVCYDIDSDRYFHSDMQTIRRAENDINHQINTNMYASLGDFYNLVGLPPTGNSDTLGWNIDNRLELEFTSVLLKEKPYLAIRYNREPKPGFHKVY